MEPNGQKKTTIIVVDDHPIFRRALRDELESQPDFKVVAEAKDGQEAVRIAGEILPDVIIMDISMPKINGIEATKQIKDKCPDTAILVLTVHDEIEHIISVIQAGAAGYLTKDVFGQEVVQAVRGLVAGENVLSPEIFQRVMKSVVRNMTKPIPISCNENITIREQEILRLAANGMCNRDIARKLELSENTVKSYMAEIFSKLGVGNRTEAVTVALKNGFIGFDNTD